MTSNLKWAILDFLGSTIYRTPEPPPRKRDPSKPMQVLCVGLPRSGTESLQVALIKLGYDYTYHGWDILFEDPQNLQAWCRLARRKWYGSPDGDHNITRADFDALIGHAVAVTDAPANAFAAEIIEAYPEAKVILNTRDVDVWHKSAIKNLNSVNDSWYIWCTQWVTAYGFWSWMVYERLLWKCVFRAQDDGEGAMGRAIRRNGKWVYREHNNMVRGMVPKERLLEWSPEDGWEPLCNFLGKEIPDESFPQTNDAAGFAGRIEQWYAENSRTARRNLSMIGATFVAGAALATWRFAPAHIESAFKAVTGRVRL